MQAASQILQKGRYRVSQPPTEQNAAGAVYKAFDESRKTEVILKETSVILGKVMTAAQREKLHLEFAAEAQKLIAIKHDSFQKVCDFFSEIDRQYLVLESVDGDTLAQLIERNKTPFALSDVANWADQLLDALTYLHKQMPPVIHRDIKPQNIKLALDGRVKLDISNLGKSSQAKIGSTATNQNLHFVPFELIWERLDSASQKVILNNFDEKSAEILNQAPNARTDIYALGATVYYLLTARLPVDALERSIDLLEGKNDPLAPPNHLNPKVSPEISDAVMKALEIKRENRFDSAAIMRQVLRTAFLRMKEREAEEAKNKPAAAARAPENAEQDILEIAAEPIPQIDLIKRLQEAEARRREAERRAAEAEKKLLEKEAEHAKNQPAEVVKAESVMQTLFEAEADAETATINKPAENNFSPENSILFAETPKQSGGSWKIAVVAAALVILGGAGFGVWTIMQSPKVKPDQSVTNQLNTSSETIKSEPTIETAPAPIAQPTMETVSATPVPSPTESVQSPSNVSAPVSPVVRNKPVAAPAPRAQKPIAPPAKTTTPEKKQITVDDLINDN